MKNSQNAHKIEKHWWKKVQPFRWVIKSQTIAICVANSTASTKTTSVEQTCKYCKFLSRGGHTLKRSEFWEDHLIDHLDAAQIRTILPCRELSAKKHNVFFSTKLTRLWMPKGFLELLYALTEHLCFRVNETYIVAWKNVKVPPVGYDFYILTQWYRP